MRSSPGLVTALSAALSVGSAALAEADPRIGDHAPALELESLGGRLAPRLEGNITIVDFFATWCAPCHQALGKLDALARELGPRVSLIVVDVGESAGTARAFFAAHSPPPGTRVVLDPDGATSARWGQHRLPTTFILDGAGVIRFINRGYGAGYGDRIEARVRALLVH